MIPMYLKRNKMKFFITRKSYMHCGL